MNKLYFAKYLPVEEEIREGDLLLTKKGDVYIHYKKYITGLPYPVMQIVSPEDKKVKLFLCSRDITIGDKLYPLEGAEDQKEGAEMTCAQDVVVFKRNRAFKVIGEISPEATWVKEGDEFEGEGIDFVPVVSDEDYKVERTGRIFYIVKGPCGHFH